MVRVKDLVKTYQLEGTIMSRDEAAKTLTIKHGVIGDWMDAMTMTFPGPGEYSIEILVNGEPKAAVPLEVVQREEPPGPPTNGEQHADA